MKTVKNPKSEVGALSHVVLARLDGAQDARDWRIIARQLLRAARVAQGEARRLTPPDEGDRCTAAFSPG